MIRTSEAVLRAGSLGAVQWILVAVVAAVVVAVAEPVGLDADVGLLALEVVGRASRVHRASLVGLVRGDVVLAVVDAVADLGHRDAALIRAGELVGSAGLVGAALLIAHVLAVVLVVALPRLEDATAIVAAELVGTARVES